MSFLSYYQRNTDSNIFLAQASSPAYKTNTGQLQNRGMNGMSSRIHGK